MPIIRIDISASTVAWYGAIVATIGGIKALSDILNDRGRLKITFQSGMFIAGSDNTADNQVSIQVTNKSKRPSKITHVGMRFLPRWNMAMVYPNERPRVLTEEHPSTVYIYPEEGLDLENLWLVLIVDARGKEYRWFKHWSGRLKWWQFILSSKFRFLFGRS